MPQKTPHFITLEGGEGVGKSTLINLLEKKLASQGQICITTREPGGTPTAKKLREIFACPEGFDPLTMESELFIVSASRSQHVTHKIKPALEEGKWVISDRFYDSTLVYQGLIGGIDFEFMMPVIERSVHGLHPELTLLLDCDVDLALDRLEQRSASEVDDGTVIKRYDSSSRQFHKDLRSNYLKLVEKFPDRIVKVDASRSPDEIFDQAWTILTERGYV